MSRYHVEKLHVAELDEIAAYEDAPEATISSVKYRKDAGRPKWAHCVVEGEASSFYLSERNLMPSIVSAYGGRAKARETLEASRIEEFEGVRLESARVSDDGNPAVPLVRLLVGVAFCPREFADEIEEVAVGRYVDETYDGSLEDYVVPGRDYYLCFESAVNRKKKLREYEARLVAESREDEFGASFVKRCRERCEDEDDYQEWKAEYVAKRLEALKGVPFRRFRYRVESVRSGFEYDDWVILPASEVEGFKSLAEDDAEFPYEPEEATEEDVRRYVGATARTLNGGDNLKSYAYWASRKPKDA